jgi:hypothetical protein
MKVCKEQVHIGGNKLCKEIVRGQNITNKYNSNENQISIRMHSYQVCMSINYSHKLGCAFINGDIKHLINHLLLKHANSTTYYP